MDALTLDIRVRVGATGDAGDSINGFIRLKPQIQLLLLRCHYFILECTIAQHHVVVGVQILWIDRQRFLKLCECGFILPLKVEQPADLVANPSIPWELEGSCPQVFERVIIFSVRLLDQRVEVVHLRSVWTVEGQPFLEESLPFQASPQPLSYRPS